MIFRIEGQLAAAIGQLADTRNESSAAPIEAVACGEKLSASRSSPSVIAICSSMPASSRVPARRPTAICRAASPIAAGRISAPDGIKK